MYSSLFESVTSIFSPSSFKIMVLFFPKQSSVSNVNVKNNPSTVLFLIENKKIN